MHARRHAGTLACVRACARACARARMHARTHACMHACTQARMSSRGARACVRSCTRAAQCNAMQCNAMQCNAMQCKATQRNANANCNIMQKRNTSGSRLTIPKLNDNCWYGKRNNNSLDRASRTRPFKIATNSGYKAARARITRTGCAIARNTLCFNAITTAEYECKNRLGHLQIWACH